MPGRKMPAMLISASLAYGLLRRMRRGGRAMKSIRAIVGNRETFTVDRLMSVLEATRLMSERQIGAVPVVDGERLVGIFTERDLMARVVAGEREARATPIGEVMSTELVVADIAEGCEVCLSRMQQARVRHLLVLDK